MKSIRLSIILVLFSLVGCASVQNLHILDRIPHEVHKGYIEFVCAYNVDRKDASKSAHSSVNDVWHSIAKI